MSDDASPGSGTVDNAAGDVPAARRPTLADVERLAARFARRRAELGGCVREVQAAIDAARDAGRPTLLRRTRAAAAARDELEAALAAAPELFRRPRTRLLSGIRVGWRRPPARVEIPDEQHTVTAIRRRFGASSGQYLREKVSVARGAVRGLPARVLAALGVTVTEPDDAPTVVPADSDLERTAAALLESTPPA